MDRSPETGRSAPKVGWSWLLIGVATGVTVQLMILVALWGGANVPQSDIGRDYAVSILWAFALGLTILAWPVSLRDRAVLLGLWCVRCFVTMGAMLPFERNYRDLDGYGYVRMAREAPLGWSAFTFGDGTGTITQLSALHDLLIRDSYHAQKVTFSFVGLIAIYLLYRAAVHLVGRPDARILVLVGVFPSILFWSSILGKDPVVLLGTALYVLGTVGWYRTRRPAYLFALAAGIMVASIIRVWNGPILLFPLLVLFLVGVRQRWRRVALLVVGVAALGLAMRQFAAMLQMETMIDLLESADEWSQAWAFGGSAQRLDIDFTNPVSLIAFLPRGIFAALFRPLPGEILNPFALLAGLENLLLLGLLAYAIVRGRIADLRHPLATWALVLVLCWATAYSIVSYQNLGTAARFKLQILPVLLGLLIYLCRPKWFSAAPRPSG